MDTQTVETKFALPDGCTMRPTTFDDTGAVAELLMAAASERGIPETFKGDEMREGWTESGFTPEKSSRVIFDAAGKLIATASVWDNHSHPISPYVTWDVLDVPEREAIGLVLLAWVHERMQENAERCPPDARVNWRMSIPVDFEPYHRILRAYGLSPVRYFNYMRLEMDAEPQVTPLPAGLSIQTFRFPDDLRRMIVAQEEAFRDHYGHIEQPLEDTIEVFEQWVKSDKDFDAALWLLVIDDASGEIASILLSSLEDNEDPTAGHVHLVATRRPWRNRGIASALLQHIFRELWNRGRRRVVLYVDDASLTGANQLYERLGMRVYRQEARYEKEVRPAAPKHD